MSLIVPLRCHLDHQLSCGRRGRKAFDKLLWIKLRTWREKLNYILSLFCGWSNSGFAGRLTLSKWSAVTGLGVVWFYNAGGIKPSPPPTMLGRCSTTELSLQLMLEYFKARLFLTYTITVLVRMCGSSQANTGTQLTWELPMSRVLSGCSLLLAGSGLLCWGLHSLMLIAGSLFLTLTFLDNDSWAEVIYLNYQCRRSFSVSAATPK